MDPSAVRLTEYSHGAGCGCKIAPGILEKILKTETPQIPDPALLVGNQSKDDAAAYDLGNGTSVLSTTDFFMPIVDDPFDFGRIAATNALSDIYAMGGTPLMAIAILGWPIDKLSPDVARLVIEGGRSVCSDAGIPLAGGHSIDAPEPIFGLAATGLVENRYLKQNNTATSGCLLFLTKPLGIGIHTTAQKKKLLDNDHRHIAPNAMCHLNKIGAELAKIEGVEALTDVTGFGLLGHLVEICEGSGISAVINFDQVPTLAHTLTYLDMGCSPGGAQRNFDSYGHKIGPMSDRQRSLLCDPQTSGGLLVAIKPEALEHFHHVSRSHGLDLHPIGETTTITDKLITIE